MPQDSPKESPPLRRVNAESLNLVISFALVETDDEIAAQNIATNFAVHAIDWANKNTASETSRVEMTQEEFQKTAPQEILAFQSYSGLVTKPEYSDSLTEFLLALQLVISRTLEIHKTANLGPEPNTPQESIDPRTLN